MHASPSSPPPDDLVEDLFRQHSRKVFAFFAKRGLSKEESWDLTQDTFLRVYRSMDLIRERDSAASYLFKTAANLFRNRLRDRSAQKREGHEVTLEATFVENLADAGEGSLPGPLGEILKKEEAAQLRLALKDLSPQMRRCVELRLYQDKMYREIAEILQVSIDTVKAHLHQAKSQLKSKLGDYFTKLDFDDPSGKGKKP